MSSPGRRAATTLEAVAEVRVVPPCPWRLPRRGREPAAVGDARAVRRLIHVERRPVVLTVATRAGETTSVTLRAQACTSSDAEFGLDRARYWAGVDDDLGPFLRRFADDAVIGGSVRTAPWLRPPRRPLPFEVLLATVCEQLVDDARARRIMRTIVFTHGRRHADLRDAPSAVDVAALAPAQLERCGLAARRAIALRAAAREVAAGRVDLLARAEQEAGWRRLRAIPGLGSWTLSSLALYGQGHLDALPAGDLALCLIVGERLGRRPGAKASEAEVSEFLAPYAGWRGVAAWHLMRLARRSP